MIDTAGTYWVKVTTPSGCTATDTIVVTEIDCYVGLEENTKDEIRIYPNPTSGELTVDIPDFSGTEIITIYNLKGEVIVEKRTVSSSRPVKLQLQDISNGVYFVQITRKGDLLIRKKFVLSHP